MKKSSAEKPAKTLSSQVYKYLKTAILKNEIKPKERIYEKEIAAIFSSSTTPVREAVFKLSSEGFIEIQPHRYAVVKESSYQEFLEISEAIMVLDHYICIRAVTALTDADIQQIALLTQEMERKCSSDTMEEYLDANAKIHLIIWRSGQNSFLFTMISQAFERMLQAHRHILYSQWSLHASYLKKSMKFHRRLLEALKNRDLKQIKKMTKNHWPVWPK